MIRLRTAALPAPVYSKSALLAWLRDNAPDLRLLRGMVDGRRVVAAQFTFAGTLHRYAATEGKQPDGSVLADAEDAVVRTSYLALARVLGLPDVTRRPVAELEREILAASMAGEGEKADALGRQLALGNEERLRQAPSVRSAFGRRSAW